MIELVLDAEADVAEDKLKQMYAEKESALLQVAREALEQHHFKAAVKDLLARVRANIKEHDEQQRAALPTSLRTAGRHERAAPLATPPASPSYLRLSFAHGSE